VSVKISTIQALIDAKLNGDFEVELLKTRTKFMARGAAGNYDHVDWQYKSKADYDKHRAVAGRSWNGLPAIIRFNGHEFAVALHSFNHSIRVASNAYDIVSPIITRATEYDKNGNWNAGHHHCLWAADTYGRRGNRTTSYDLQMRNAVMLAEQLSGASPAPKPTPTNVNYTVTVNATGLNVRGDPSNLSLSVAKVSSPLTLDIVKESQGPGASLWGQIGYGVYKGRWIALDYTKKNAAPIAVSTYTVISGDTLTKIALKHTGNAAKWGELYNLNIAAIGADPGKIYVGQKLTLPAGW